MPAYDFMIFIAFDAFRAMVPTGYVSARIEHENAVVFDTVYQHANALFTLTQRFIYSLALRNVPGNSENSFMLGGRDGIPGKPLVGPVFT